MRSGLGTELRRRLIAEGHGSGSSSYSFLLASSTQVSSKKRCLSASFILAGPEVEVPFPS